MTSTAFYINTTVTDLWKAFKRYRSSAIKITIAVLTIAVHQLVTIATFHCPCVNPSQLTAECVNNTGVSFQCTVELNVRYGLSFVIGPTVILFFCAMAIQPRFWEVVTGTVYRRYRCRHTRTIYKIISNLIGTGLISPVTWLCMTFIDGEHLACAVTALPYDVGEGSAMYSNCDKVLQSSIRYLSNTFHNNQALFQSIGWSMTGVTIFLTFLFYLVYECSRPLTYYQAKLQSEYYEAEDKIFKEKMEQKAQKEATSNVDKFLSQTRTKEEWDGVTLVQKFKISHGDFLVGTALQKWALNEDDKPETTSQTHV